MANTTFSGPVISKNGFVNTGPGMTTSLTADTTLTVASHAGKILLTNDADGKFTLPSINVNANGGTAGSWAKAQEMTAAGVLSVDTTGGDSMTSTLINAIQAANDGFTLSTGMNYLVAGVTGSSVVTLPSGSSGDVVIVKAGLITGAGNLKISSSLANGNQIDGFSEARIESSYGAVSLVYTVRAGDAHGDWVIY